MTRYSLTIPTHYNDGQPIPRPILYALEEELVEIGGGFTASAATGAWASPSGAVVREPVTVYAVDSEQELALPALEALAERTATALGQEAIYLTRQELDVQLVAPAAA